MGSDRDVNDRSSYAYFYDNGDVCIILDWDSSVRKIEGYFICERNISYREGHSPPVKRVKKSELEKFCAAKKGRFEPRVRGMSP